MKYRDFKEECKLLKYSKFYFIIMMFIKSGIYNILIVYEILVMVKYFNFLICFFRCFKN